MEGSGAPWEIRTPDPLHRMQIVKSLSSHIYLLELDQTP